MFKLAIEVCIENHFGLIRATFLSLGSTKSLHFFGTPGIFLDSGHKNEAQFFWDNLYMQERHEKDTTGKGSKRVFGSDSLITYKRKDRNIKISCGRPYNLYILNGYGMYTAL